MCFLIVSWRRGETGRDLAYATQRQAPAQDVALISESSSGGGDDLGVATAPTSPSRRRVVAVSCVIRFADALMRQLVVLSEAARPEKTWINLAGFAIARFSGSLPER